MSYPANPMCRYTETTGEEGNGMERICVAPRLHASTHYLWTMQRYNDWLYDQAIKDTSVSHPTVYTTLRSPFAWFGCAAVLSSAGFVILMTYIILKWWGLA